MNSRVKLLTKGGETRLLLKRDQKRDQAKGKALVFFSKNVCRYSSTTNVNLDFPLEQLRLFPLKTQGTGLG